MQCALDEETDMQGLCICRPNTPCMDGLAEPRILALRSAFTLRLGGSFVSPHTGMQAQPFGLGSSGVGVLSKKDSSVVGSVRDNWNLLPMRVGQGGRLYPNKATEPTCSSS